MLRQWGTAPGTPILIVDNFFGYYGHPHKLGAYPPVWVKWETFVYFSSFCFISYYWYLLITKCYKLWDLSIYLSIHDVPHNFSINFVGDQLSPSSLCDPASGLRHKARSLAISTAVSRLAASLGNSEMQISLGTSLESWLVREIIPKWPQDSG